MLTALLVLCVGLTLASACSCASFTITLKRLCRYDVVLRGTVTAQYEESSGGGGRVGTDEPWAVHWPWMDTDVVYSVQVDTPIIMPEELRGREKVEVRTSAHDSLCGTRLPLDVPLVIMGWVEEGGRVHTGLCDRNSPWERLGQSDRDMITNLADHCANGTER